MRIVQIEIDSLLHAYDVLAVCSAAMRCNVTLLLSAASFLQHVRGPLHRSLDLFLSLKKV